MAVFLKKTLFNIGKSCSNLEYGRLSDLEYSTSPSLAAVMNQTSSNDRESMEEEFDEKDVERQSVSSDGKSQRFQVSPRVISDAIIGLSDGLTVPFALTAGLSALGNARTVVYGGLAELIAGSISMGLGGYLGAKSEIESYYATLAETEDKILKTPHEVKDSISALLVSLDLTSDLAEEVSTQLQNSSKYTNFCMHFLESMTEPPPRRAISCALTIALGYFIGGFIPLVPYFFVSEDDVQLGLMCSAIIMVCTLFTFGYGKTGVVHGWSGWANKRKALLGALEMVLIGSIAAGAAMGLVYAFTAH